MFENTIELLLWMILRRSDFKVVKTCNRLYLSIYSENKLILQNLT